MKDADQIRIAPGSVFLSKQEAVSWYRAENAAGHKFPELSETLRRALRFYFPQEFISWDQATIAVDEAFKAFVRGNTDLMVEAAKLIAGDQSLTLDKERRARTEKIITLLPLGQTVRLDSLVYCTNEHILNFEYQGRLESVPGAYDQLTPKQRSAKRFIREQALEKRMWKYASMTCSAHSRTEKRVDILPKVFTFCLCRFDPFGQDRTVYASRFGEDWSDRLFPGAPQIFFVNLRAWDKAADPQLRSVLQYFCNGRRLPGDKEPLAIKMEMAFENLRKAMMGLDGGLMVEGLFDRIDRMAIEEDARAMGHNEGKIEGKAEGKAEGKEIGTRESLLRFVYSYMQSTHESLEKAFEVLKVSPNEQAFVRKSLSQAQP